MGSTRVGQAGPKFGTIDEAYGIFENVEFTTDVEETELMNGQSDVVAVDQTTRRTRLSGEFTFRTNATITEGTVGSGSLVTINGTDTDINRTGYMRSYTRVKTKGDYMKIRFEATSWPHLGS